MVLWYCSCANRAISRAEVVALIHAASSTQHFFLWSSLVFLSGSVIRCAPSLEFDFDKCASRVCVLESSAACFFQLFDVPVPFYFTQGIQQFVNGFFASLSFNWVTGL